MPTSSWRKSTSVIQNLAKQPQDFHFVQIVRLLETAAAFSRLKKMGDHRLSSQKIQSIAFFSRPESEALRFRSSPLLTFPETCVSEIYKEGASKQWQVLAHHMGLTGAMGVLPYHYTELLLKRIRLKDESLRDFLDLFNHRTLSLFYRASTKYRPAIEYNRTHLSAQEKPQRNDFEQALRALIGIGTKGLQGRQLIKDETLLFYSGLLNQQQKTSFGLKQLLSDYFDVPVRIEQFVGTWQELIPDVRTRLGSRDNPQGQNVCLGKNSMLGKRGWFAQGKSRIVIGPLNQAQFDQFSPGTPGLNSLNELTKNYMGMENDYDYSIEVDRNAVPKRIKIGRDEKAIVGWNTWLSGKQKNNTPDDDVIKIAISSSNSNA